MALQLRQINNTWIAIGINESPEKPGDIYISDDMQEALEAKFFLSNYFMLQDKYLGEIPTKAYREIYISEFDEVYHMENASSGKKTREEALKYKNNYINLPLI